MKLRDLLRKTPMRPDVAGEPPRLFDVAHGETTTFTTTPETFAELLAGTGTRSIQEQFLVLETLADEGRARPAEDGFEVTAEELARLSDDEAQLLRLPGRFTGHLEAAFRSTTTRPDFAVDLSLRTGRYPEPFRRTGAVVTLGLAQHAETYRLSPPALRALRAVEAHQRLSPAARTEARNMRVVAELQAAQRMAASQDPSTNDPHFDLDLRHFEQFTTRVPERVGVVVEPQDDGSLAIMPDVGVAPADLRQRWHQLPVDEDADGGVLRVGKELVLLDRERLAGVREVRRRPRIPKEQVREFLGAPGAFFDPDLVDVELRFSWLVAGLGRLAPVTFAQAADAGPEWISKEHGLTAPEVLAERPRTVSEHEEIEHTVAEAWERGEDVIPLGEDIVDISNRSRVEEALAVSRERVTRLGLEDAEDDVTDLVSAEEPSGPQVRVGWMLDDAEDLSERLRQAADNAALQRPVDYASLCRTPYPHQVEGIEWMARLMQASLDGADDDPARVRGALLADDMGLGKTFMTLAALAEAQRAERARTGSARPTLAVMPVALLENWLDELEATFGSFTGPFDDVVVLQGEGLAHYRTGRGRETAVNEDHLDHDGMVRRDVLPDLMRLRVGERFGDARLDRPGTLVLTTYDTIGRYQVSLAQVDWGTVVFDEAQALKNPDILRTRAAKALRARFKLLATGTPVENSLRDFWSLLDAAQPGLLGSWAQFRERWDAPMREATGERHAELGRALRAAVGPFMLRRVKEDHLDDLPPKILHTGEHARMMPPAQVQAYDDEIARYRAKAGTNGAMLGALQRLAQVSLHPGLVQDEVLADGVGAVDLSARTKVTVREILDGVRAAGEKAIVFASTKRMQRALALWLRDLYDVPVDIVNGDTPATGSEDSRVRRIRRFEQRPGFGVIIMSPLAVGVGLTVVGANHAIHLERHWNPAKEAQATDRVYRIGQTRPVHVYHPMAIHPDTGSFDVNLDRLLRSKIALKDAVVVPEAVTEDEVARAMGLA
ncbi:DEAD/DEAH box helicase [Isoptericola variabilis]|uniref:SNF2-related protein n=2 Tax=Isoptericola TaxID=254250 RepID=F6FPD4_ISOV2|nr:DEAD/DEAH box helicase [Isoptericola variabilis]AEG43647.1 SNF2-related protein [Isoptericola variabilis 225]